MDTGARHHDPPRRCRPGADRRGLVIGLLVLAAASGTAMAATPQGVWLTENKDAALTISPCGSYLCGRIIWMESATDESGSRRLDRKNPDPAKQGGRICGMVVISGLEPAGAHRWKGNVYNPQDGKTYSGDITVVSERRLRLRAYIGLPIFGKGETWTRVDDAAANEMEHSCRRG